LRTLQSASGVLEFLAQALPFLRAPLGRQVGQYNNFSSEEKTKLKERFITYKYVKKLLEDWDGTDSIYNAFSTPNTNNNNNNNNTNNNNNNNRRANILKDRIV